MLIGVSKQLHVAQCHDPVCLRFLLYDLLFDTFPAACRPAAAFAFLWVPPSCGSRLLPAQAKPMSKRPCIMLDDDGAGASKRLKTSIAATTPPSYAPASSTQTDPWINADSADIVTQLTQLRDDNFTETDWVVTDRRYDDNGTFWELWNHRRDGWAWWWSPDLGMWYRDRR